MKIKRLAISMRSYYFSARSEFVDTLSRDWYFFLNDVFRNIIIVPILNGDYDIESTLNALGVDGIILSGGNDIGDDEYRDKSEYKIIDYATANGMPLLGICRGMQVINQYFGGIVNTDVSKKVKTTHVNSEHPIKIVDAIFQKYSEQTEIMVNSYHNHGVFLQNIPEHINVMATSDEMLVEGLYHETYPIIGLQWHVERANPSSEFDKILINKLFDTGSFWLNEFL